MPFLTRKAPDFWYGKDATVYALLPFSGLFRALASLRRAIYRAPLGASWHPGVPVVVVGNLTVGGTGKTPLTAWIATFLQEQGFRPGIVLRGYGGRARCWPQQVRPDSDPVMVGDEAVLLARRACCPVVAAPDRVAAARALVSHTDCDLILSDDGLQHYALARDVEIVVLDGDRGLGNGYCLPAGPLREPLSRLASVDLVVNNGAPSRGEYGMKLTPVGLYDVAGRQGERSVGDFVGRTVHAVCGIGCPHRFFRTLEGLGLRILPHAFADHHVFTREDIVFGDDLPVLMTEKDAVKCSWFAGPEHWYLPVTVELHPAFGHRLLALIQEQQPREEPSQEW